MTDLVDRLREAQPAYAEAGVHGEYGSEMLREAADRIEAQQAEIDRLREVLREIAERSGGGFSGYKTNHLYRELRLIENTARAALKESQS